MQSECIINVQHVHKIENEYITAAAATAMQMQNEKEGVGCAVIL